MQQIKPITDLELYLLDIIKWEYIDKENSYIGKNGEIFLKINTDVLPIPNIEIKMRHGLVRTYHSVEEVLTRLIRPTNFIRSKYYIVCDYTGKPIDLQGTNPMSDTGFVDVYGRPKIITDIMSSMEGLKYVDRHKYYKWIKNFSQIVEEWVTAKIRESGLFADTKGKFVADKITDNTYLQKRDYNGEFVYYMMAEWWANLVNGTVTWVDIDNGEGKTFSSL